MRKTSVEKLADEWAVALVQTLAKKIKSANEIYKNHKDPAEVVSMATVMFMYEVLITHERIHGIDFEVLLQHHINGIRAYKKHLEKNNE